MFLISTSIRVMFSIRLILCMRAATSPPTRLSLRSSEALTAVNSSLTIIENEGLAIYQLAKSFVGLQTLAGE